VIGSRQIVSAAMLLVASSLSGCGDVLDQAATSAEHRQAEAWLARWAAAVEAGGGKQDFVPTAGLTGQVGDWEPDVGDNNKPALMAGLIEATAVLPDEVPPAGEIRWADGTKIILPTISASKALQELRDSPEGPCPECAPLQVTGARLSTAEVETSRGPAAAPAWEYTLAGTKVVITRIAVAADDGVELPPVPWDANNPPTGLRIDSATGTADGRQLTVSFVGAPDTGDKPCGADYTAEAVESATAVVIIVTSHGGGFAVGCTAVGARRTATAELAEPLGQRAVLEVVEGRPVPVFFVVPA
jgi:hypothetical protein